MTKTLTRFIQELRRRKVIHTLIAYLAVAWVILQVTALLADALKLPDWTLKLVLVLAALGLPIVLTMAWVFDLSRRGVVRTASHSFAQDNAWLAAVLHLRLSSNSDDGTVKPRRRLQQAIEMSGCLWHHWSDGESTAVFSSAEQAIAVAVALQKLASELRFSLQAGIAIGRVQVDAQQHLIGEAALIAAALSGSREGVALSGTEQVHDELRQHSEFGGRYLRAIPVDRLPHPVRMYELHWHLTDDDVLPTPVARPWRFALIVLMIGGAITASVVFFPRGVHTSAITAPSNAVNFVALQFNDEKLSMPDYLSYGIKLNVQKSLALLPEFYLADERTKDAARFLVTIRFAPDEDQQSALTALITDQLNGQQVAKLHIQRNNQGLSAQLHEVSAQLLTQLANYTQKTPPPPLNVMAIEDQRYITYLRAHAVITESDGSDDWQKSEAELERAMQGEVAFAPLLVLRCNARLLQYKYLHQLDALDAAKNDCLQAVELAEPDAEAWRTIGEMWWLKGDGEKAEQAYKSAIAVDPRASQAYSNLSLIYAKRGDLMQAERILVQATMLQPGYWAPLRALAKFQFTNGRYKDAVSNYQRVVELLPNSAGAYNDLGAALFFTGKLQEAANSYRLSIQIASDQDALSNLGTLYYYLGRMSDAIDVYQKAISITPDHFILHGNLADAYRQANRLRDAKESYQRALDLIARQGVTRDDAQTLALSGHYYASLNDCEQAQKLLQRAVTMASEQAEVQFNAAIVAMQCHQSSEAIKALTKAKQVGYPAHLMSVDPDLAPLSSQPEFLALVTQSR